MATSELNQFLENIDEMVLECTICFKRLQNPKSLSSCLHSFCLACLEDWVKVKGQLTCPTCSTLYPIPEGGLQKLPPNTFINNLLETIEQFSKDQMICICAKEQAKYYCQECRHYLCSTCTDHHQKFPMLANHKLHSVEDVQSMTPLQISSLHPPKCSLHKKPLEFFCSICNSPICMHCTITDHSAWEGNHKPISISKAFQTFKETSVALGKAASDFKNKLEDGLKAVTQKVTKLEESKDTSLRDIDNHIQEMVKKIKENGDQIKKEVQTIYKKKKKVLDVQTNELNATISDVNTKLSFLNQLLKSDEATAMQSSETVITALKKGINELPKTEPNDNGEIYFFVNNQQMASLQSDIGRVTQMRIADCLTLMAEQSVSQDQTIVAKVIKTEECEIQASQLNAKWTKTNISQVQEDDSGKYFVREKCTSAGACRLDVSVDGEPIKQSPMVITVAKEGLVNTIEIFKQNITDVVKCDDCLLVSSLTNEILKYKQSGEYIGKVTLPQGVQVNRMYKMKNGNIVFSDWGNKCITVCNMNGQVSKSIGQEVLKGPAGIHVDEASNTVYVGERDIGCVLIFDINTGKPIRYIGSKGTEVGQMDGVYDITLTNKGHILVLELINSRLQLLDKEGRFMKVLVETGEENGKVWNPRGVVVDEDSNIIVSSLHKLQIFNSDGKFIKVINKEPKDGIKKPWGLSIISYYPRRLAVANNGDKTIKIFNY